MLSDRNKTDILYTPHRFEAWSDFVDFAVKSKPATSMQYSRSEGNSDHWTLGADFDKSIQLANNGWSEASQPVKAMADKIVAKSADSLANLEVHYDVTGSDFDIGALLSGAPEYWYRMEHTGENKTVKLVFNCSTSGGISGETMRTKGAVVAALIYCLELTGVRVEVVTAMLSSGFFWSVKLKDAEQPLDIDRLTFALAHPATLRRLGFAVMETDKTFMTKHGSGYGTPQELPQAERGDIYIGSSYLTDSNFANPEVAGAWVIEELKRQGIEVAEN